MALGASLPAPGSGRRPALLRRLGAALALLILLAAAPVAAAPGGGRQQSSIVLDFATGEVLHASDPDAVAFPASLTKMMTLYLVFEAIEAGRLTPATRLKISARAAAMPPTKLGLKAGSSIKVEDAVMALVTKSANDIAAAIGENLGGSEARFAELMTARARGLGMERTTFRNASGLPDPQQRTTARDLAALSTRLITDFPQHYRFFARKSFAFGSRTLGNHNRLLRSYAGMDGIKTGYTNASGFNLAGSAVRDGRRLVAVVMGGGSAASRDAHMARLLDRGFVQLAKRGSRPAAPLVAGLPEAATPVWMPAPRPEAASVEALLAAVGEAEGAAGLPPAPAAGPAETPAVALAAVAAAKAVAPVAAAAAAPRVTRVAARAAAPAAKKRPAATKSAARAAAPRRAPGKSSGGGGAYGVQVGVYSDVKTAQRAAQLALKRAPAHLRGTLVSVNSVKQRKRMLFRAQLIGLGRGDALGACKLLQKHRQDCLVIQAGPITVASS